MFINKIKNMEGVFFVLKRKERKESFYVFIKSDKRDVGYFELQKNDMINFGFI